MSNLNSLFNVARGWPGTGTDSATITEVFRPHSSVPADNPLREGDIVIVEEDGTVSRATALNLVSAADVAALAGLLSGAKQFWLVIDGNEATNYDTLIQSGAIGPNGTLSHVPWKVTCIRGTYMFETTNVVSRAYKPGDAITVIAGKPDITAAGTNPGFQKFGEVREYDAATGKLTISV